METQDVEQVLAGLPAKSPFRKALKAFVSGDEAAAAMGRNALKPLGRAYWEEPKPIQEQEALAALRATLDLEFPKPKHDWENLADEILFVLFGSAYPSLLHLVEARYADADRGLRLGLLTLVASAGTRRGAELLVSLVQRHGWPETMYARFITELRRNEAYADTLFPALLEVRGGPWLELVDVALEALRAGTLTPARLEESKEYLELGEMLENLLRRHEHLRDPKQSSEDPDGAESVSAMLGAVLDLAGFVGGRSVLPGLRQAVDLPEKWPASFAIVSLLRRGEKVPDRAIARIASDASVRAPFWSLLQPLDATGRIPEELRNRDAFAEADMVGWLAHPNELGRPPDELEKMAVFNAKKDGKDVVLYVWRFRSGKDDWMAGISGLYPAKPPEGPLSGSATFSRFDPWKSQDAEGHALAVLKTLKEWSKARR